MQSHTDGHEPGQWHRQRLPDPGLDPLQPVVGWIDLVGGGQQGPPKSAFFVLRQSMTHVSRSSTVRSVAMALAVWLFTAPLLICIASAICASDMSA
jgi:hypothetical protein